MLTTIAIVLLVVYSLVLSLAIGHQHNQIEALTRRVNVQLTDRKSVV